MRRDLNVKHYVGTADELYKLKRPGDFFRISGTSSTYTIGEDGIATSITDTPEQVYQALLTQLNTIAPSSKVLSNSTGLNFDWEYVSTGIYKASLQGNYVGKISVMLTNGELYDNYLVKYSVSYDNRDGETDIYISTYDGFGTTLAVSDGILNDLSIRIELFPDVSDLQLFASSTLTENWQDFFVGNVATHVQVDRNLYHDGFGYLPTVGANVYTDVEGTTPVADGNFYYLGVVSGIERWFGVSNGVVTSVGTYDEYGSNG